MTEVIVIQELLITVFKFSLSLKFASGCRIYISELSELGIKTNIAITDLLCG